MASMLIEKSKGAHILCLSGDLGAGKTTLAQNIIFQKTGTPIHAITSPTYNYVNKYQNEESDINHFDLYRINSLEAFDALGLNEELQNSRFNIIEWPEILEPRLQNYKTIKVHINHSCQNTRTLCIQWHMEPCHAF